MSSTSPKLTDSWALGPLTVPNRVVLAPLAGIGNWCVRLQARRFGAGLTVSEMVSSHAIHHRNEKTMRELLRIHPDERATDTRGPVAIQLFGNDPDVMASAAETVAAAGADVIDLNMGCPVPKVCKTGAGAALLRDPDRAVALARAAGEASGLPVTVKLRPGQRPGERDGVNLARRLAEEAGVAAIAMHPRHASQQHRGRPDYELAREIAAELPVPFVLSGGLRPTRAEVEEAMDQAQPTAVMLARGVLGNPWLIAELLGERDTPPTADEVLAELHWLMDRMEEHMGPERSGRWLRKAYPWYIQRLAATGAVTDVPALQDSLQRADSASAARGRLAALEILPAAA
jgi:tRNA-dihydrouridine synthase B